MELEIVCLDIGFSFQQAEGIRRCLALVQVINCRPSFAGDNPSPVIAFFGLTPIGAISGSDGGLKRGTFFLDQ
jgi:hypothetical protein